MGDPIAWASKKYGELTEDVGEWAGEGGEKKPPKKEKKKPPQEPSIYTVSPYGEPSGPYALPSRSRDTIPKPSGATRAGIEGLQTPGEFAPSREAVQAVADAVLESQAQKDIDRDATRAGAHGTAQVYGAGADPPGQGKNTGNTPPPSDTPLPKGGTGPGASSAKPPDTAKDDYYGDVKAVKTADGQIAFVDVPAGKRVEKAGGEFMDYSTAVREAGTRVGEKGPEQGGDANFVSGPSGTAYFTGDDPGDLAAAIPATGDRSPGWATRQAYRERYKAGDLSMDPRDIMDRRRWEQSEEARDMEMDLVRAQADAAIAAEEYKLAESEVDPLERARIAAEGKYGGQMYEEAATAQRVVQAVSIYQNVMKEIERIQREVPPGPERDKHISMLERFARDQANIIMGHAVRDPREDPLAALVSTLGRSPTTPEPK